MSKMVYIVRLIELINNKTPRGNWLKGVSGVKKEYFGFYKNKRKFIMGRCMGWEDGWVMGSRTGLSDCFCSIKSFSNVM